MKDEEVFGAESTIKRAGGSVARHVAPQLSQAALDLLEAAKTGDHRAVDFLWEAVGPDAIEDWWEGGRDRESTRLAEALASGDPARVGEVVGSWAVPYLNHAGGES